MCFLGILLFQRLSPGDIQSSEEPSLQTQTHTHTYGNTFFCMCLYGMCFHLRRYVYTSMFKHMEAQSWYQACSLIISHHIHWAIFLMEPRVLIQSMDHLSLFPGHWNYRWADRTTQNLCGYRIWSLILMRAWQGLYQLSHLLGPKHHTLILSNHLSLRLGLSNLLSSLNMKISPVYLPWTMHPQCGWRQTANTQRNAY